MQKPLRGSFAGFAAAFLAGLLAWTGPWVGVNGIVPGHLWWPSAQQIVILAAAGAAAAMVAEAWPSQWDDNANIPFWTGLIVWGVAALMDIPLKFW